ncbi:unnamed protein product [Diplocarpon coronariae]
MPFFPQAYLPTEAPLIQLLSQLDPPRQEQQHQACVRCVQPSRTFKPCFDIAETSEAYELYGELPGARQHDLNIQFSDAQTLVIQGKTERRSYNSSPAPAPGPPSEESSQNDESSSLRPHTATVEDEYDEADAPLATTTSASSSTAAPATAEKGKESDTPRAGEVPRAKFWVAERRVGEFARSFTFEKCIEHDYVTASLRDGVLAVVIPKSMKSKKVAVSVL